MHACPGLAFGAHWSLMASLASEWFGLRNFASNYCLLQVLVHNWRPLPLS
jgi:hypothetical protein